MSLADVIWQRTQTTIKTIENWCHSKALNVSALKTKIFMFTWNRKWSLCPIEVCGETIELSNEVKLLGITLDRGADPLSYGGYKKSPIGGLIWGGVEETKLTRLLNFRTFLNLYFICYKIFALFSNGTIFVLFFRTLLK